MLYKVVNGNAKGAMAMAVLKWRQQFDGLPEWVALGDGVTLETGAAGALGLARVEYECRPGHVRVGVGEDGHDGEQDRISE